MNRLRLLLLAPLLATPGCAWLGLPGGVAARGERMAAEVTIARDEWGRPAVEGKSDAAVAFGLAYAMAEDNFWQIEEDYLHALGRAAHWYGERALGSDLVRSALQVVPLAHQEYREEPVERRRIWDAFAAGLNHYLDANPQAYRRLIRRYEGWMVLARARAGFAGDVVAGMPLASVAELAGAPPVAGAGVVLPSRAWALAPALTGTGRALLVASVSAPFFGRGQLYEVLLRSDEGWHVEGVAELGMPLLRAGRSTRYAWAPAGATEVDVELRTVRFASAEDALAYHDGTAWHRAALRHDTVRVNTSNGVMTRVVPFLDTPHGTVIARRGDTAWLAAGGGGALQRSLGIARATDRAALLAATRAGGRPQSMLIAAEAGTILHVPATGEPSIDPVEGWLASGVPEAAALVRRLTAGTVSPDSAAALPFDARVAEAESAIARLVDEWEQVGGSNPRRAAALDDAVELLRAWDGVVRTDSEAATLWVFWRARLARAGGDGSYDAFRALEDALAELRSSRGTVRVAWGEASRLLRTHTSGTELFREEPGGLPLAAAPETAGTVFAAELRRDAGRRLFARAGAAWIAVLEPGEDGRSAAIVPFGQSAEPASRHFFDQAEWYVRGRLRDGWFGEAEVQQQARRRYAPGAPVAPGTETATPQGT